MFSVWEAASNGVGSRGFADTQRQRRGGGQVRVGEFAGLQARPGGSGFFLHSPDSSNAEGVQLGIGTDNGDVKSKSLSGDHAVEGVAMIGYQAAGTEG